MLCQFRRRIVSPSPGIVVYTHTTHVHTRTQDSKKGQLREFKRGDLSFNYGCFPQTWEDPTHTHPGKHDTHTFVPTNSSVTREFSAV